MDIRDSTFVKISQRFEKFKATFIKDCSARKSRVHPAAFILKSSSRKYSIPHELKVLTTPQSTSLLLPSMVTFQIQKIPFLTMFKYLIVLKANLFSFKESIWIELQFE
jgi:hypothetical protein